MSLANSHSHEHVFLGASHDENARRTLWVVMLTVVMMVVEIAAGALTGSMALLADGFHMATHAGALGIAAAAYAFAKRHAHSPRYSFGTGKVGDLGGFASALILALVSLGIGVESVMRLLDPAEVQFGTATLIAVVGLVTGITMKETANKPLRGAAPAASDIEEARELLQEHHDNIEQKIEDIDAEIADLEAKRKNLAQQHPRIEE